MGVNQKLKTTFGRQPNGVPSLQNLPILFNGQKRSIFLFLRTHKQTDMQAELMTDNNRCPSRVHDNNNLQKKFVYLYNLLISLAKADNMAIL